MAAGRVEASAEGGFGRGRRVDGHTDHRRLAV
jgi:hypothetical protein